MPQLDVTFENEMPLPIDRPQLLDVGLVTGFEMTEMSTDIIAVLEALLTPKGGDAATATIRVRMKGDSIVTVYDTEPPYRVLSALAARMIGCCCDVAKGWRVVDARRAAV